MLGQSIPTHLLCQLSEVSVAPSWMYSNSLAKPCPEGTEGPYYVRERSERTILLHLSDISETSASEFG
jgi:hypothetical protein